MLSPRLHETSEAQGTSACLPVFSCYLRGRIGTEYNYQLLTSARRGPWDEQRNRSPPGCIDLNETDCPGKMARLHGAFATLHTPAYWSHRTSAEAKASDRWPQRLSRASRPIEVVAGSPSS